MRVTALIILCSTIVLTASGQQRSDEIRLSIYFGGGSYSIDDAQITNLYEWLDSIPNLLDKYQIHLISHTDPIGGKQYNEWLSQRRSEAVQQTLLFKNIPDHKITITNWDLKNLCTRMTRGRECR